VASNSCSKVRPDISESGAEALAVVVEPSAEIPVVTARS